MTDYEVFLAAAKRILGGDGFIITDEQTEPEEPDSSGTVQFTMARMSPVPPGVRPLKSPRKAKRE